MSGAPAWRPGDRVLLPGRSSGVVVRLVRRQRADGADVMVGAFTRWYPLDSLIPAGGPDGPR